MFRSHHLVTPLMLAAGTGDHHLVNTLIEFDARVEDSDKDGNTAFFYAKNKKKVQLQINQIMSVVSPLSDSRYS